MAGLVDTILGLVTGEFTRKAAGFLGESPENTQKAVTGAVPALLASVLQKVSSPQGAKDVFDLLGAGKHDGGILSNLASLTAGGADTDRALKTGQSLLATLLGSKSAGAASLISNLSGLKSSSATSLLSMVAPILFGVLGKESASRGLNASGLANLLISQKKDILDRAPAGLAGVLGLADLGKLGAGVAQTAATASTAARGGSRRLVPIMVLAGAALLGWALTRNLGTKPAQDIAAVKEEVTERTDAFIDQATETAAGAVDAVKEGLAEVELPGGLKVNLAEGTINYNLAKFLADANAAQLPKSFVFDRLNFESGLTTLTADSHGTVNDLAAILKAYSTAEVRLEGHTDTQGDESTNQKLSMSRAEAVKAALVAGGIDATRIGTSGYGSTKPLASNTTEEGRAQNRRLELVVVKK